MSYRIHCDASELECTESIKVVFAGSPSPDGWTVVIHAKGNGMDHICPKHVVRPMDKLKRIKKR